MTMPAVEIGGAAEVAGTIRNVLHVTEAPLGGVVAYLEEMLASQVAADGAEIALITPEINLPALARVRGARFHPVVLRGYRRKSLLAPVRLAAETIRQAWRTRPEILHVHSTIAGAIVRACRPFLPAQTAIVYCPHGWAFSREGKASVNRVVAAVERVLSRACDSIICISEHEREEARRAGLPAGKLHVIENGVSPRTARADPLVARPPGPRRIVFAGRFDRQKGFDTYLEVMRRLGDAAEGIAIGRQIVSGDRAPEIPANVRVTGWLPRDEVYALYAQADMLIVPSRWEGFGLVAVEAMQAGLPVFASRVGGLQDIVEDGRTGRLFAPDDVEGILTQIRETGDETLRAYGAAGRARYLEHYTAERMNARMAHHYAAIAAARAGR